MLRKLLPRNDTFYDFFERHAAQIVLAAENLLLFDHDHDPLERFKCIKACELEADKITRQCVEALHKTFITPIERTDIHHLISKMDDIVDEIEDVARLIYLYKLQYLQEDAMKLAQIVLQASKELQVAVRELRRMKRTNQMTEHFINIHNLENEADTILVHALGRLFEEEKDLRTLIKWKEVYEHLEHATDSCDDVANILEGILIEYE